MTDEKGAKILEAATQLFLRYGLRRVNMHDIAKAAGISRPTLYAAFGKKSEIFAAAYRRWADETIARIESEILDSETPEDKLRLAFEIWFGSTFDAGKSSPEVEEFQTCAFEFEQSSLNEASRKFEAIIAPMIEAMMESPPSNSSWTAERVAHLLVSAVRGFYQVAQTSDQFRALIGDLMTMALRSVASF